MAFGCVAFARLFLLFRAAAAMAHEPFPQHTRSKSRRHSAISRKTDEKMKWTLPSFNRVPFAHCFVSLSVIFEVSGCTSPSVALLDQKFGIRLRSTSRHPLQLHPEREKESHPSIKRLCLSPAPHAVKEIEGSFSASKGERVVKVGQTYRVSHHAEGFVRLFLGSSPALLGQ